MEKLRVVLEKLKKFHFWILCGLIVLIALGVWFVATSDRAAEFAKQKSKIDSEIKSTDDIHNKQDHPNEVFITALKIREGDIFDGAPEDSLKVCGIKSGSDSLSGNVNSAAKRLFDDQRNGNPLPVIYGASDANLQKEFEEDFKKVWHHKIEDIEKPPADAKPDEYVLGVQYRTQYRDRIKDIFPQLFVKIERRTEIDANGNPLPGSPNRVGDQGPGGFGSPAGEDKSKRYKGVLNWPDAEKLMDWFHNWNDTPSTIEVVVAQEDLWVYEALLNVIRNTNDMGNDPRHDPKNYISPGEPKKARIKEIIALEIGSDAAQSWAASENSVFVLDGAAAPAALGGNGPIPGGGPSSMRSRNGPSGFTGRLGASGGSAGSAGSALAGRYVDNAGKPIDDPAQDPNKEFRMMPIDMRLIIEQKEIPRLLVECANSSMRIDVRAVRILAEPVPAFDPNGGAAAETSAGAAPAAGGPSAKQVTPGRGSRSGGGMLGNQSSRPAQTGGEGGIFNSGEESVDASCPPVPVEIQGIIYIYNPPTSQAPGGENASGQPPGGGVAPATTTAPANGARR
jgi:hypothetical protein